MRCVNTQSKMKKIIVFLGIKDFPEDYKDFLFNNFIQKPKRNHIIKSKSIYQFLNMIHPYDRCYQLAQGLLFRHLHQLKLLITGVEDPNDSAGFKIVPFATLENGDFICFDFTDPENTNPPIVQVYMNKCSRDNLVLEKIEDNFTEYMKKVNRFFKLEESLDEKWFKYNKRIYRNDKKEIAEIETILRRVFPEDYKNFLTKGFERQPLKNTIDGKYMINTYLIFVTDLFIRVHKNFLPETFVYHMSVNRACFTPEEINGTFITPFATTMCDKYFAFDYRENPENPSVIVIDMVTSRKYNIVSETIAKDFKEYLSKLDYEVFD